MTFGTFHPDDILKRAFERHTSIPQLEKLGNVWVSPDIAIEKPIVVKPDKLLHKTNIVLNKTDLPAIDITKGAMGYLSLSTRSFWAQSGIEIIFDYNSLSDKNIQDISEGKDTLVPVYLKNYGQRAVEVEGNVMRFFWVNDEKRLRGRDLLNAVKSVEFTVEGVEGEDWFLGGFNEADKFVTTGEGADKGLGVTLRLRPEKFYIPYAPEPVRKDKNKSTRNDLSTLLKPIPAGSEYDFEIGETPRVKLGPDIVGVINMGGDRSKRHIYSPFIDSGSDWPIRTETLHGLKYVEFFLYRK